MKITVLLLINFHQLICSNTLPQVALLKRMRSLHILFSILGRTCAGKVSNKCADVWHALVPERCSGVARILPSLSTKSNQPLKGSSRTLVEDTVDTILLLFNDKILFSTSVVDVIDRACQEVFLTLRSPGFACYCFPLEKVNCRHNRSFSILKRQNVR